MKYGYARVSTTDQDLTVQIDALKAAGCETIRSEKVSGTSTQGRDELKTLLEFMRSGDELVITRIDRLARSARDLQNIVYDLTEKGVTISATEQSINTNTPEGKCFLDMLSVFAEFETNLRKERQMEGIAKAKERGVYTKRTRTKTISVKVIRGLKDEGLNNTEIAAHMGISRSSVQRAIAN